jgi:DNA-binding MarR family transcriptional regulator
MEQMRAEIELVGDMLHSLMAKWILLRRAFHMEVKPVVHARNTAGRLTDHGKRLLQAMLDQGYTQADIARELLVSRAAVNAHVKRLRQREHDAP